MRCPDWSGMTYGQKVDAIRAGMVDGLSFSQIAATIRGANKNKVLGFVHQIGMTRENAATFSVPERQRNYVRARKARNPVDKKTQEIVERIDRSGVHLIDIAVLAGIDTGTISRWRTGQQSARPFNIQCVSDALDILARERCLK